MYSVTQDFNLELPLSRSPPIPLFLEALSSNGVLISNIGFDISDRKRANAEKVSLSKAIEDAKLQHISF